MKNTRDNVGFLTTLSFALCLGVVSCSSPQNTDINPPATPAPTVQGQIKPSDSNTNVSDAEKQARPDIENRRKEAEQQAQKTLDQEAIAAIAETEKAILAIAANNKAEALAAIERATGKINILLARNPATGLLPVAYEVEVIDAAPLDTKVIRERINAVDRALVARDLPTLRVLLDSLTSEIHVRTHNLPLATYPEALKEAARLLDQQKNDEAATILLAALNTLAIIDRVIPLPIVIAQEAIIDAEGLRDKDKDGAQRLLETARLELERAKLLGYAGNDPEYEALNTAISDIETQLKANGDTASVFSRLKERVAAFFQRQSESEKRG